jgi:hypothetical protein
MNLGYCGLCVYFGLRRVHNKCRLLNSQRPNLLSKRWLYGLSIFPRELFEGTLLGSPKDMLSNAVELAACFHRGPAFV